MVVDVSEIKEFRHCRRKWQLSSRNQFHLTAHVPPKAFKLGTVFHECLHKLYLGKPVEQVEEYLRGELAEGYTTDVPMLVSMVRGYAKEVIPTDSKFVVLDIEHHFRYSALDLLDAEGVELLRMMGVDIDALRDIEVAGSIDMIALDTETNQIWGFEHKTAKNFRNDIYLWMDEQPRVYYAALQQWVERYNARRQGDWAAASSVHDYTLAHPHDYHVDFEELPFAPAGPRPATLGGVYINEVRKLVRAFQYKRSALTYPEDDLRNFLLAFLTSCAECHKYVNNPQLPRLPLPDMLSCMNCMYNGVCQTMQYQDLALPELLREFGQELKVREQDHLEEKQEVVAGEPDAVPTRT